MKKCIVFLVLISCIINVYCQEKDSIIYIFPDKVEQKLYDEVIKRDYTTEPLFIFYLETIEKGQYRLTYSTYSKDMGGYWTERTNKFILINKSKYPLVLDYDSLFGTRKLDGIGDFGNREGTIQRSFFIYEGYNITFDKNGGNISEDWGIYKKITDP